MTYVQSCTVQAVSQMTQMQNAVNTSTMHAQCKLDNGKPTYNELARQARRDAIDQPRTACAPPHSTRHEAEASKGRCAHVEGIVLVCDAQVWQPHLAIQWPQVKAPIWVSLAVGKVST